MRQSRRYSLDRPISLDRPLSRNTQFTSLQSLPASSLVYSVAYWDGQIPSHSIQSLIINNSISINNTGNGNINSLLNKENEYIFTGSMEGQIVRWKKDEINYNSSNNNNSNTGSLYNIHHSRTSSSSSFSSYSSNYRSQSFAILPISSSSDSSSSSSSSIQPRSPAINELIPSTHYLYSTHSDGSICRWSLDGSQCFMRSQSFPLNTNIRKLNISYIHNGSTHNNNNNTPNNNNNINNNNNNNGFNSSLSSLLSRIFLIVFIDHSSDIYILDSYNLCIIRKLLQPGIINSMNVFNNNNINNNNINNNNINNNHSSSSSSSSSDLYLTTEDNLFIHWNLDIISNEIPFSPTNNNNINQNNNNNNTSIDEILSPFSNSTSSSSSSSLFSLISSTHPSCIRIQKLKQMNSPILEMEISTFNTNTNTTIEQQNRILILGLYELIILELSSLKVLISIISSHIPPDYHYIIPVASSSNSAASSPTHQNSSLANRTFPSSSSAAAIHKKYSSTNASASTASADAGDDHWIRSSFINNNSNIIILYKSGKIEILEFYSNPNIPSNLTMTGGGSTLSFIPSIPESLSPTNNNSSNRTSTLLSINPSLASSTRLENSLITTAPARSSTAIRPESPTSSAGSGSQIQYPLQYRISAILETKSMRGRPSSFSVSGSRIFVGSDAGELFQFEFNSSNSMNLKKSSDSPTILQPNSGSSIAESFGTRLRSADSDDSTEEIADHSLLITDGLRESEMTNVSIFLARAFSRGEIEIHRLLSSHPTNEPTELTIQLHRGGSISSMVALSSHESLLNSPILITAGSDCQLILFDLRSSITLAKFPIFSPAIRLIMVSALVSLDSALIAYDDLIGVCCSDRSVRFYSLSTLSPQVHLRGLDSPARSIHRFPADLVNDRIAVRTESGQLYLFSIDGSLEEKFDSEAAEVALLTLSKQSTNIAFDYLADLRWATNSELANQHPVTLGSTNAALTPINSLTASSPTNSNSQWLMNTVSTMATTPLVWIKNSTKFLYKQASKAFYYPQFSPSGGSGGGSNNNNPSGNNNRNPLDSSLIESFDSYPSLHLTVYSLSLATLANQIRIKYSSLTGHGSDKSAVYKALLTPFLDFDLPAVSQLVSQHFSMKPPDPLPAFSIRSSTSGATVILFPFECIAQRRWNYSPHFTALHSLSITTLLMALLNSVDKTAHSYYSQLEHYYNSLLMKELSGQLLSAASNNHNNNNSLTATSGTNNSFLTTTGSGGGLNSSSPYYNYTDPDPRSLLSYALCQSLDIQTTSRFLLKSLLQRSSAASRFHLTQEFGYQFDYSLPRDPVFDQSKSAMISERKAVRRAEKVLARVSKTGESLMVSAPDNADPAASLVGNPVKRSGGSLAISLSQNSIRKAGSGPPTDSELLSALIICYAILEDEKQRKTARVKSVNLTESGSSSSLLISGSGSMNSSSDGGPLDFGSRAPFLTRVFLRIIQYYHANTDSLRFLLALHLLGSQFDRLHLHLLPEDLEPFIQRLFAIALNDHDSAVQSECQHLLLLIGERNANEYLVIMGRHATNIKLSLAARKSAVLTILGVLKTKFPGLPIVLPLTVHIISRCLDPNESQLRVSVLPAAISVFNIIANHYGECSLYQSATANRLAIVNNSHRTHAAVVWDLNTGKKYRTFNHKSVLSVVQFSPDGSQLATFSPIAGIISIWRVEDNSSGPKRLIRGFFRIDRPLIKVFSVSDARDADSKFGEIAPSSNAENLPLESPRSSVMAAAAAAFSSGSPNGNNGVNTSIDSSSEHDDSFHTGEMNESLDQLVEEFQFDASLASIKPYQNSIRINWLNTKEISFIKKDSPEQKFQL